MKVLFVVPAKNEENRIKSCLISIKNAFVDYADCKIVVVDNGSSDSTVLIAKKYANIVCVKARCTVAALRNYAASLSDSDILVFVDADVLVDKFFLRRALPHFKDDEVAIVTGYIDIPPKDTWVQRIWLLNRVGRPEVCRANWSSSMNMVVKKNIFDELNGFNPSMVTCEDVEFSMRVNKKYKIIYNNSVRVTHCGEAKSLAELFKKERWRGRSSLHLFLMHCNKFSRWFNFLQVLFFSVCFLFSLFSILILNFNMFLLSFFCLLVLPLLRALRIAMKSRSINLIHKIFTVWLVYYLARMVALFDGFSDIWHDMCKFRPGKFFK